LARSDRLSEQLKRLSSKNGANDPDFNLKSQVATWQLQMLLGQLQKSGIRRKGKMFIYSLLCCHRPTSPKLKRSLKKVTDLGRILRFNFEIGVQRE
jgi:hypothetical protein